MIEAMQTLGTRDSTKRSHWLAIPLALVAALIVLLALVPGARAGTPDGSAPDFRRYVTVKFKPGAAAAARSSVRAAFGAELAAVLGDARLQQIALPRGSSAAIVASILGDNPAVEFAVPSGSWRADDLGQPAFDDPFLPKQWSLENTGQVFATKFIAGQFEHLSGTAGADINAPAAWGGVDPGELADVPIGVVDTGIAYEHPDLAANIVSGGDFYDGDSDPRDPSGHGTHVASIAGAVAGNGLGIAGVDPWAKLMPLRAADAYGNFSWAAIEQAVAFGLANGVRVFNGSFGGPDRNPAFEELMRVNPQALFVFSAGNGGGDGIGDNHDTTSGSASRYPCDSSLPNVICVGSSDASDAISTFSDFGVTSVDLLAPGDNIYAARPCVNPATSAEDQGECPFNASDPTAPVGLGGGPYAFQLLSGTSMAAPVVAGAIALLWGKCTDLKASQIKKAIVSTVAPNASVSSKIAYGGRLDVGAAVASIADCPAPSDGLDWPQPPAQPEGPGGDDGGGGTGPIVPPVLPPVDGPPIAPPAADGGTLRFQVLRPASAKLGRSGRVSFRLRCSAACSAALVAQPLGSGVSFRRIKSVLPLRGAGTRTITVRLRGSQLRSIRALQRARVRVRMKFALTVTDAKGISALPVRFGVRLTH
jgi:subtilisin family serine protease